MPKPLCFEAEAAVFVLVAADAAATQSRVMHNILFIVPGQNKKIKLF